MPEIFKKFTEIKTEFRIADIDNFQKENPDVVMFREQLHSSRSFYVSEYRDDLEGDALFTDKSGLKLAVRTADCLAVLFYNPKIKVVGAAHAGWRGTEKQVLKKTITKILEQFEADPKDFFFYFGPAALTCCYDKDFVTDNKKQVLEFGVSEEQIEMGGECTVHNDKYPSNVREKQERKSTLISIIKRT